MDIQALASAVGALEGVTVLDVASGDENAVLRFTIDQADEGWWSFELLCSLESQFDTGIEAHLGNGSGMIEFVMHVPKTTMEKVHETVDQLVSAA